MSKLPLSVALSPYEHALDLLEGRIAAEGVDINWLRVAPALPGERFADRREFDVAEMALSDYVARLSRGERNVVAIPIFLSRQFMQGAVWVRAGGPMRAVEDLRGGRISYAADDETVAVYARQWLQAAVGLDAAMDWPLVSTSSLHAKLAAGEIDVGFSLNRPPPDKSAAIHRLFSDVSQAEHTYYEGTKIFPVLRVLCIQRDLIERHRWLAASLFDGFDRAKRNSLGRIIGAGMSRYPLPWLNAYVTQARAVFGEDFWPYGVQANQPTLQAFLQGAQKMGIIRSVPAVEDLFDETTRAV